MKIINSFALVAQLVEQRFCKPQVVGSYPAKGSRRRDGRVVECTGLENLSAMARNPIVESPKFGGNPLRQKFKAV